jgi:hypothetical protein
MTTVAVSVGLDHQLAPGLPLQLADPALVGRVAVGLLHLVFDLLAAHLQVAFALQSK